MENTELFAEIKGLIAKGELKKSINLGIEYLKNKDFISIASRYNRIEKANQKGTITFEQYQVELNKITESLLGILQKYPEKKQKKKKRHWFILWLAFSGLFTDWDKLELTIKYLAAAIVIVVSIALLISSEKSENIDSNSINNLPNVVQRKMSSLIHSMLMDSLESQDNLWIGTSKGLSYFDGRSQTFTNYLIEDSVSVQSILQDGQDNLWIGTSKGLNRFNSETRTFYLIEDSINVQSILQDRNGYLWIGTSKGLSVFDSQTETFTNYLIEDSVSVQSILQDGQDNLWIGTSKGLSRFDSRSQTFTNYLIEDSVSVQSILQDHNGYLWIGTSRGLSRFDSQTKTLNYLIEDSVSVQSILQDRNGYLWIGTSKGLSGFDSEMQSYIDY